MEITVNGLPGSAVAALATILMKRNQPVALDRQDIA